MHGVFGSFGVTIDAAGLEEEMERLRREKDQLDQERARTLESERKVGEELKMRNRELIGKIRFVGMSENSFILVARY